MIQATIRMKVPGQKVREALETLRSIAERTRVEPGCASCRIYYGAFEEDIIMLEEFWKTREDLNRHLRSASYRNVLLVVEMASEEPEIKFHEISASTGVETIMEARAGLTRNGPTDPSQHFR